MAFKKGTSGNPAGRPKGTPNTSTLALRSRISGEVDPVAFLGAVMRGEPIKAKDADGGERILIPTLADMIGASKVLTSKLVPDAKDSPVVFELPAMTSAEDAAAAIAALLQATAAGEITPSEAHSFVALVKPYVEALQASDFERRLKEIEERLSK